jgi:hypothetical protein
VRLTNLPDWLIYGGALALLLFAADSRRLHADAPAPPPPVPGEETATPPAVAAFNGAGLRKIPPGEGRYATAFSIGEAGVWVTAQSAVEGCRQTMVVVAPGRGAQAKVQAVAGGQLALLLTDGGVPALALGPAPRFGEDGFMVGYPHGGPGEAAGRFLEEGAQATPKRGHAPEARDAWVEIGRTDGIKGVLWGLEGAPVLDGMGRVQGVVLSQAPRRGRFYAAPLEAVRQAMILAKAAPAAPDSEPVTTDNYGRAADTLRRDLRVAQAWCG